MKRLPLVVLAALALPAGAAAKELTSAQVCGASGCQEVRDREAFVGLIEDGGPPASPPAKGAPFYRVSVRLQGDPQVERLLVSPAARRVRGFDGVTWFSMPARNRRIWLDATLGLRPFPAAKLPAPATGGALPPRTYRVAARPEPSGGTTWWPYAALAALLVALGLGANRLRAPLRTKLRKETDTWESSTTRSRSSPGRPAA